MIALFAAAALADWRSSFSTGRYDVAILGSGPKESLLAGLLDFCIFAPLFGRPLNGPQIRAGK